MKLLTSFALVCSSFMLCAAEPSAVVAIYPSAATLPANHLKFYLHFRTPMRQGVFLEHCKLLDERGREISEPFRETELWNENGTRLTLWLHPGRQKSGVNLNTDFGPVLAPGRRCTLLISRHWPSQDGMVCSQDTRKDFFVGPRETRQLDPAKWQIHAPTAGTRQPLDVHFPAPLDHALLMRCLRVRGKGGHVIAGTISTAEAERCWRFTPDAAWQHIEHHLVVDTILEDLAGNSLARPFEVNLDEAPRAEARNTTKLQFKPATAAIREAGS